MRLVSVDVDNSLALRPNAGEDATTAF